MAELKFESLHNHTLISDGTQTHVQALEAARRAGIGVMALTDHDTLPDAEVLAQLRAYTGPVRWTVGVELSSYVPKELGGPEKGAIHVLGLFVDLDNKPLREFCATAEQGRWERMRHMLAHLHEHGFEVTEAEVVAATTSKNIVLPHIVKAVMSHDSNRRRLEELREQMRREAEHNPQLKRKYDDMMADGPRQYPYTLVMTRHAYVPVKTQVIPTLLDFDATARLVREAGGLAFFAHWFFEQYKVSEEALVRVLERGTLDGLETAVVNTMGKRDLSDEVERVRELVRRFDLAEEMGADSHSAADLEAFSASKYAAGSVGQTARLIERFKPDLRWSNLGE